MIPGVGDVSVPPGWFKNARASKGRAGERPREDSPPSWPDSWTGVEVPTDPLRPPYPVDSPAVGIQEENQPWGAASAPHGVNHVVNHHRPPVQDYYSPHADYARHQTYDQRTQYFPPPTLAPPSAAAAASARPTRLPPLADAGVDSYRDSSPFTSQSSSSASSEFSSSPLPTVFAAPHMQPAPPPTGTSSLSPLLPHGGLPAPPDRSLVPLAILKTINPPLRDPMAEDCLRRLSNTPRLEARWSDMRTTLPTR
jgi:Gti1/Pac2 family transcription factor